MSLPLLRKNQASKGPGNAAKVGHFAAASMKNPLKQAHIRAFHADYPKV
ncbi:hypothetical protein [Roseivivax lentus]|nr:hypothetical protein [Roseivivax lentus]